MILEIIAAVILIEAITNAVSKSALFAPIREFLFNRKGNQLFRFMHNMIDCPYCLSAWVGTFCAFLLYLHMNNWIPFIFIWLCIGVILHRLSNILHFVIDRIDENHLLYLDGEEKSDG